MGIAYSNLPISVSTIRTDTSANFRGDLDGILLAVGWVGVDITNGRKYLVTSPQGLTCHVKIWDSGATEGPNPNPAHYISFQVATIDDAHVGYTHRMAYNYGGTSFQVIANKCQLFISEPTFANVASHPSVALGIPFIPDTSGACAAADGPDGPITSCWWSNGENWSNFWVYGDWRCGRYCNSAYSYCLNDVVTISALNADGAYTGGLRIYPLTPTDDVDNWYSQPPRIVKYHNEDPMYYEPIIGWLFRVRGQLWDALIGSRDVSPVDGTITTEQTDADGNILTATWKGWSRGVAGDLAGGVGTYFATLYLLMGTAGSIGPGGGSGSGESNYAY